MGSPRPTSRTWILLALLTLCSFALRFGAIGRLLPLAPEPDASLVWVYREMSGEATPNPELHAGVYPDLLPKALHWVSGAHALDVAPQEAPLEQHLEAASSAYLRLRVLVAAISFLLAPIAFFVARRWLGDGWALACGAFVALGLLHIAHSSVAKAHAAEASFAWLTLLCALRQMERPTLARVLSSALAGALAIGTIQTGFFVLPALVLAALFGWRGASSRGVRVAACLAPVAAVLGGLAFVPGGLKIGSQGVTMGGHGHTIFFELLDGRGLRIWPRLFFEHDPVLALLAALGLLALAWLSLRAWREAPWLLVASYVLPYATIISLDKNVADRYLLTLYPCFGLLAALALRAGLSGLRSGALRAALCALVFAWPAWSALRFTWIGTRPTTLEQLGAWISAQPQAARAKFLLSPSLSPPLFPTQEALAQQLATTTGRSQPWFYYLGKLARVSGSAPAYDLRTLDKQLYVRSPTVEELQAYFERERPEFVVLELTRRIAAFPGSAAVARYVFEHAQPVATFSGEGGRHAGDPPIDYQDAGDLARRVLGADAFGPHLVVLRWPAR